jgi:hypothetical protein
MKTILRNLLPSFLVERIRRFRRYVEREANRRRTVEEVFTDIYAKSKWGGKTGEFCSGGGSTDEKIVSPYVSMVAALAVREAFQGLTFVDLGCGDFRVGKQLLPLCSRFIGVDIVKPLIVRNQELYGSKTTQFLHLNIIDDELPQGGVCFLRQVLQHLSNEQISKVLRKLGTYRWVFITEHYPQDNDAIVPNREKPHGGDIRTYENSGVYLTEPPFSLPLHTISMVLEVFSDGGTGVDREIIRTFLYKPCN